MQEWVGESCDYDHNSKCAAAPAEIGLSAALPTRRCETLTPIDFLRNADSWATGRTGWRTAASPISVSSTARIRNYRSMILKER